MDGLGDVSFATVPVIGYLVLVVSEVGKQWTQIV